MIDYLFTDEIKREVVKVLSLNEEERQKYLEKKLRKLAKDIDFPIDWNDLTVKSKGGHILNDLSEMRKRKRNRVSELRL